MYETVDRFRKVAMSSAVFLWSMLGGGIILLILTAVVQFKKPHQTSFGPPMLTWG
jgi:hypothetical protein